MAAEVATVADRSIHMFKRLDHQGPGRSLAHAFSYARDPRVRAAVIARANAKCELCDEPGFLKPDGTHATSDRTTSSLLGTRVPTE